MKRSLLVLVALDLVLAVTLIYLVTMMIVHSSDPLAECIGYCETYWGDTDSDPLTPMLDEGEYYACVDTCKER